MKQDSKKMQNVHFNDMNELLAYLPENQLLLVEHLRGLIFECIPDIKERLSFNVPFYSKHKGICYIWPGAVPWGAKISDGIEFGFNYGYLLVDENNYLDKGSRKQVHSKRFKTVEEINDDLLRVYLYEAVENDEIMYREKMMNKRQRK